MVGDLVAGTELEAATSGVDAVIHCASDFADPERTDVAGTRLLLGAARSGGTPHVLYISIVGVDRTAFPYYHAKRTAELLVEHAELPWTILRTTQFHGLVAHLLQSWGADALPEIPVPTGLRFQSIDVGEVADRLVALFERGPSGHVPDLGGPQILSIEEMAQSYLRHRCRQATIHAVEPASEMLTMMRTGIILTPEHAEGKVTWEQYLERNG
jgi:uncharacterized protein YbjT (DUF2867 family)